MALLSGAPVAIDATQNVYPLGAGTSFYISQNPAPGADYQMDGTMICLANTDNQLSFYARYTDFNNKIEVRYNPLTTTLAIIETVAGVPNILATTVFDIAAQPGNLCDTLLALIGNQLTVTSNAAALNGVYTTAVLAAGTLAVFWDATGAGNLGLDYITATL